MKEIGSGKDLDAIWEEEDKYVKVRALTILVRRSD